jgi:hypothetical protein
MAIKMLSLISRLATAIDILLLGLKMEPSSYGILTNARLSNGNLLTTMLKWIVLISWWFLVIKNKQPKISKACSKKRTRMDLRLCSRTNRIKKEEALVILPIVLLSIMISIWYHAQTMAPSMYTTAALSESHASTSSILPIITIKPKSTIPIQKLYT